jgi:exodeoxyribonuclease-3
MKSSHKRSTITRVISWNIRAGGGKRAAGILAQLLDWQVDIIGLSEFRGTPASQWLAAELADAGFQHQLDTTCHDKPAKNALLLASRKPLQIAVRQAAPNNDERWLLAESDSAPGLHIGLMHIPNYTTPTLKYPYMASVLELMNGWDSNPAILMGDTNCGKRGIDEERPSTTVFRREHDWIVDIEQSDWNDAFRFLHGDRREYTWYSHRNNGFRLDYAFCNPSLIPAIKQVQHIWGLNPTQPDRREGLSDHAALVIDYDQSRIQR